MDFEGKRLGVLRGFAGFASLLLLLFSLSLIWVLTEQTPTQTGDLTRWFANIVDDVRRGSARESDSEAGEGKPDFSAQTPPCSIVEQPVDSSVRIGELVSFKVVANDAVAYLWECTDPGTPGWYQIGGVDATKSKYEFEMTKDLAWMEECDIRCLVTFADGSSSYSDEVQIEFRDVMRGGQVFPTICPYHRVWGGGLIRLLERVGLAWRQVFAAPTRSWLPGFLHAQLPFGSAA